MLLSFTFHVLKTCCKWIQNTKNGIPKENTQKTFKNFRNILSAETANGLLEAKAQFFKFEKNLQFKQQLVLNYAVNSIAD